MSVVVSLTEEEATEAQRLANATYELFKNRRGYYRNLRGSHLRGKLGEFAVAKWGETIGLEVETPFRDISAIRLEDVTLGRIRVEVKTWDHSTWEEMGRCVAPGQLPSLRGKADAIVWCSVRGTEVTLHGWSTLDDVEAQPVRPTGPKHYLVNNHQVPPEQLRPLELLLARVQG